MKKLSIFLAICLLFTACGGPAPEKSERQIFAMDTIMTLSLWGGGEAALQELQDIIYETEARMSVTREDSVPGILNRVSYVQLLDREAEMISRVLELSEQTKGVLDPCLYPVTSLWGFTTGEYRVPSEEEIAQALKRAGRDKITLDGNTLTIQPNAALDLGAAVKGWAGQLCADRLDERGDVRCAMLYLGGNIQTYGTKVDGTPWHIGIQDPAGEGTAAVVDVEGTMSVVTSGDYQRYFEEGGERYCHIMDPATGHPADSGLRSVTIIMPDGLMADCLSTTLYILGLEKGLDLWWERGDFEAIFIDEAGTITVTAGLENAVTRCEFEVAR